jgi:hypothetical protein
MNGALGQLREHWRVLGVSLLLVAVSLVVIPSGRVDGSWRAVTVAFLCGALVGASEIVSRYRDEPLGALLRSPFGPIYVVVNGYLSFLAALLILRYPDRFAGVAADQLLVGLTAGFGATVVMRTRLAVIRGPDGKDISIGPDAVISGMLQLIDANIDRYRAARRQALVVRYMPQMRKFGSFPMAARYLLAALLAFQHLDDALKTQLNGIVKDYETQALPADIKYLALGFVFLTVVGDQHYAAVLDHAVQLLGAPASDATGAPPTPAPA